MPLQHATTRVIAFLEIIPAAAALEKGENRTLHRRVFIFVDNDATRASLVKMASGAPSMRAALLRVSDCVQRTLTFVWYARVPSSSNPADAPSRLADLEVLQGQSKEVPI